MLIIPGIILNVLYNWSNIIACVFLVDECSTEKIINLTILDAMMIMHCCQLFIIAIGILIFIMSDNRQLHDASKYILCYAFHGISMCNMLIIWIFLNMSYKCIQFTEPIYIYILIILGVECLRFLSFIIIIIVLLWIELYRLR